MTEKIKNEINKKNYKGLTWRQNIELNCLYIIDTTKEAIKNIIKKIQGQ